MRVHPIGVRENLERILRSEGPLHDFTYGGVTAMGLGAGSAHTVYFYVNELYKRIMTSSVSDPTNNHTADAVSGL
ncbi:unnamed protein product [Arabidopsis halleri]